MANLPSKPECHPPTQPNDCKPLSVAPMRYHQHERYEDRHDRGRSDRDAYSGRSPPRGSSYVPSSFNRRDEERRRDWNYRDRDRGRDRESDRKRDREQEWEYRDREPRGGWDERERDRRHAYDRSSRDYDRKRDGWPERSRRDSPPRSRQPRSPGRTEHGRSERPFGPPAPHSMSPRRRQQRRSPSRSPPRSRSPSPKRRRLGKDSNSRSPRSPRSPMRHHDDLPLPRDGKPHRDGRSHTPSQHLSFERHQQEPPLAIPDLPVDKEAKPQAKSRHSTPDQSAPPGNGVVHGEEPDSQEKKVKEPQEDLDTKIRRCSHSPPRHPRGDFHHRSPPRAPRSHLNIPTGPASSAAFRDDTSMRPDWTRRSNKSSMSTYSPLETSNHAADSPWPPDTSQLPPIPVYKVKPNDRYQTLYSEILRLQAHRAHLTSEYRRNASDLRRAMHELEMSTIDLRAAENRRKLADDQLDRARAGVLGIDAIQVT